MSSKRIFILVTLMMVSEAIFLLPFVVARIFRPTFLSVFEINNFQLGSAFSLYGIVAMVSYFFGGPIADRFSTKNLIIGSLLMTSIGGVVMGTIPSFFILTLLYGFWGLSTILFFWAAYVKATREFGGEETQGMAFGSIEAGRGFFAAVLASASVFIFATFLPYNVEQASPSETATAFSRVIYLFSGFVAAMSLPVWFFIPNSKPSKPSSTSKISFEGIRKVIGLQTVWLQATIVLCAYVGYKCTDIFSLYASDVMGFNDVNSAHVGTVSFWIRPLAALAAGFLGDRSQFSKIIMGCFLVVISGCILFSCGLLKLTNEIITIFSIAFISAGIYGLRGIYFALFQEAKLPILYTGSAVGLVSTVGYTPDIFMGPLIGLVLDNNPGELGYQYLFIILSLFSILGLLSSWVFLQKTSKV